MFHFLLNTKNHTLNIGVNILYVKILISSVFVQSTKGQIYKNITLDMTLRSFC